MVPVAVCTSVPSNTTVPLLASNAPLFVKSPRIVNVLVGAAKVPSPLITKLVVEALDEAITPSEMTKVLKAELPEKFPVMSVDSSSLYCCKIILIRPCAPSPSAVVPSSP